VLHQEAADPPPPSLDRTSFTPPIRQLALALERTPTLCRAETWPHCCEKAATKAARFLRALRQQGLQDHRRNSSLWAVAFDLILIATQRVERAQQGRLTPV